MSSWTEGDLDLAEDSWAEDEDKGKGKFLFPSLLRIE